MNLYLSLTRKCIKENKKRTIVTIIGIILSAALISGIGTITESLFHRMIEDVVNGTGGYYGVFTQVTGEKANTLKNHVKVDSNIIAKNNSVAILKDEKKRFNITKVNQFNNRILPVNITTGREAKNSDEIIVTKEGLKALGHKKIGEKVYLNTFDGKNKSEKKEFTIVGVMDKGLGENSSKGIFRIITYMENVNSGEEYDVYLKLKSRRNIESQFNEIAKDANIESKEGQLPIQFNDMLLSCYGESSKENLNKMIKGIFFTLGSLVIIATIVTVYNSFSIAIVERKKLFSTLASVGASKGQIKKMVFAEGIFMSVIGIPIGIFLGTVTLNVLFKVVNHFFKDSVIGALNLQSVISLRVIIVSFIVVFITVMVSAFYPAKRASKTSIIDGIRGSNDYKIKKVKSGRFIKIFFGIEGQFAYKNLKRNKKKYRITLISLVFSIILFITFNGTFQIVKNSFDTMYSGANYEFYINTGHLNENEKNKLEKELFSLESIENISKLRVLHCNTIIDKSKFTKEAKEIMELEEKNLKVMDIMSLGEREFKRVLKDLETGVFNEKDAIEENGVILLDRNKMLAKSKIHDIEMFDFSIKDSLNLMKDKKEFPIDLKIQATTKVIPTGMDVTLNGPILITSDKVFYKIYNDLVSIDKDAKYTEAINIKSSNIEKTKTSLNKVKKNNNIFVVDITEEQKTLDQTKTVVIIFFDGFIAVITLIGLANIINTVQTNISLRKREFAMVQSIGITPKGLNKILYFETMYYGAMSLIIALPISSYLCYLVNNSMAEFLNIKFTLPIGAMLISIIGIFIVVLLAGYFPIRKFKNENIIENIRQENI